MHDDIGTHAIEREFATPAAIRAAKTVQLRARLLKGVTIGVAEALLLQGTITPAQFDTLLRTTGGSADEATDACGPLRFGEVAVVLGYLSWAQFETCLDLQRAEAGAGLPRRLIGEVALARNLITTAAVDRVLAHLVARAYPDPPDAHTSTAPRDAMA